MVPNIDIRTYNLKNQLFAILLGLKIDYFSFLTSQKRAKKKFPMQYLSRLVKIQNIGQYFFLDQTGYTTSSSNFLAIFFMKVTYFSPFLSKFMIFGPFYISIDYSPIYLNLIVFLCYACFTYSIEQKCGAAHIGHKFLS